MTTSAQLSVDSVKFPSNSYGTAPSIRGPYGGTFDPTGYLNDAVEDANFVSQTYDLVPMRDADNRNLRSKQLLFSVTPVDNEKSPSRLNTLVDIHVVNKTLQKHYYETIRILPELKHATDPNDKRLWKIIKHSKDTHMDVDALYNEFKTLTERDNRICLRYLFSRFIVEKFLPLGVLFQVPMTPERLKATTIYNPYGAVDSQVSETITCKLSGETLILPYWGSNLEDSTRLFLVLKRSSETKFTDAGILKTSNDLKFNPRSFAFFPIAANNFPHQCETTYYNHRHKLENARVLKIGSVVSSNQCPPTNVNVCNKLAGIGTDGQTLHFPEVSQPQAGTIISLSIDVVDQFSYY
jgi:hypothetical protein